MGPTRVVVRQGSPHSVHDLRKVGAGRAKSIIKLINSVADRVNNDHRVRGLVRVVFVENYRRFHGGQPLLHRVDFDRGY